MAKEFFSAAPDPENPDKPGTPGQENIPEYTHPVSFNSGENAVRKDVESTPEKVEINPEAQKETELKAEEKEAKENIEKLPAEERQKLGIGIHTVGFAVQEKKNEFFEKTYDWLSKNSGNRTAERFFAAESKIFKREGAKAHKRIEEVSRDKNRRTAANAGLSTAQLGGTIVKYGRTVADIVGITAGSPLRYAMMGSMAFARGAEGVKEVRLMNENVIDKTRIQDADKAAEEAWRIREEAVNRSKDGKITAEELNTAYKEQLPQDLLKRLEAEPKERAGLMNRIVQGVCRKEIGTSAKNLSDKLEKIDKNDKFSAEQKKGKREALFRRYEKRMDDYDRILTQYGTVDMLAMGARYMELAGKTAVAAMTVETLFLTGEKLVEISSHLSFGHLFESIGGLLAKSEHTAGAGGKGTGFFSPDMIGHSAHTGVIDTSASGRAQADSIFGSHGTIPESGAKEVITNIGGKPPIADTAMHPAADAAKVMPGMHEQPAWAHDAAVKDTTMPSHVQEQPIPIHDVAKANPDTAITQGGGKGISPNIVEKPVISEAVPQPHEMGIEKGGGIFAAAHKMVEQGTVSEKDFAIAWANPESTALVNGVPVPLHDVDLVHQGDSVRFVEGVNGKPPHLELVLGGKGKAGTVEDLYNAQKNKSEYVQRKVLGITEKEALQDVARSKKPGILEAIRNAIKGNNKAGYSAEKAPLPKDFLVEKSGPSMLDASADSGRGPVKELPHIPKPASERINELDPRYWRNEPASGEKMTPFKEVEPQPDVAKTMTPFDHSGETMKPFEHIERPVEPMKPFEHIERPVEPMKPFESIVDTNKTGAMKPFESITDTAKSGAMKPFESITDTSKSGTMKPFEHVQSDTTMHPFEHPQADTAMKPFDHSNEAMKPFEHNAESITTAKAGNAMEQMPREIRIESGSAMEGIGGRVTFNYDQSGNPIGMNTEVSVRGVTGNEFLKQDWLKPLQENSAAKGVDWGFMVDRMRSDGRNLYMYEKIYEQISKDPANAKQAAYLAKTIKKMIEIMTKQYGDVIDAGKLPKGL